MQNHVLFCFCALIVLTLNSFCQSTVKDYDELNHYNRGIEYYESENYIQAINFLDKYLQKEEEHENKYEDVAVKTAMLYSALAAKKMGTYDARYKLRNYVELYNDGFKSSLAYFNLGSLEYKAKKYREAIRAFKKVQPQELSLEDLIDYRFELAYSLFANKEFAAAQKLFGTTKDVRDKYFDQSNYYYAYLTYLNKDYEKALSSFQRIDNKSKYKYIAPYYITYIYYQQKKYDELLSYAGPIANDQRQTYSKEINQLIGQTYFTRGDYNNALPYLQKYTSISKKLRKEDIYQLAFAYYQTGQYGAAIKNFEQLTILNDKTAQFALYSMADSYLKSKDKEKARNAYAEASKMDFDNEIRSISAFNYAQLSYDLNYYQDAIRSLTQIISANPDDPYVSQSKSLLASVFERTNNYKEALTALESFKSLSESLKGSYQKMAYLRGLELHIAKKFPEAAMHFKKSKKYNNDKAILSLSDYWLGDIYYNGNKPEEAKNAYNSFLKSPPLNHKLAGNATVANANYSLAYIYFRDRKFDKAKNYFNKASSALQNKLKKDDTRIDIYTDALLRSGDCSFIRKDYTTAKQRYDIVYNKVLPGADYAAFQRAIITGLMGNYGAKIDELDALVRNFPQSLFVDDAFYEKGTTYLNNGNFSQAEETFKHIVQKIGKGVFVTKSLIKLGLINFNLNNNSKAMDYYKEVAENYPNTRESREALTSIKDLYIEMGDPNGYFAYTKTLSYVNVTDAAQDSVTYLAAEAQYANGNCGMSIGKLTDYIISYKTGNFSVPAHFYRAECYTKEGDYKKALADYKYVIDQSDNIYTEKALSKGAYISYTITKDYQTAHNYFTKLYYNSTVIDNLMDGLRGLVQTSYHLNQNSDFEKYSRKLLNEEYATNEDKASVYFYSGKFAFDTRNYNKALNDFKNLQSYTKDIRAAEAKYLTAEIHYKNKSFAAAKENAFQLVNNLSSYDYWVIKTFLLLSDIYSQQGELFQAKATLQSIIDNYQGKELLNEAKRKLELIKAKEMSKSKIEIKSDDDGYLEVDTINSIDNKK